MDLEHIDFTNNDQPDTPLPYESFNPEPNSGRRRQILPSMGQIPDFENCPPDSGENLAKSNPREKNSNEIVGLDGLPQSTIMSMHEDDSKNDGMDKEDGPAMKRSKFHSAKSGHASQMATSWTHQKANTLSEPVLDIEEEDDYDGLSC
jgi:hypothetical protein